mgnify:FL=1|tara:strand:- start:439 stop:657 length:219 start_codon:yes stop_codon:yes gene_type:complete
MKDINLQSSLTSYSKCVTQIVHFIGGEKRTFHGVLTETIKQGQFTKIKCKNGTIIMINDKNVLCIEIFKEED